ncbi:hypothetical protein L1987_08766 [Smallanthus sonchifolius]|uniref:Uncharacterized protein n=1 Tax=Smallanthus sonchifolius TaxID=185202 RepID=A0ACB9JNB8_9ASTR|nr:hypothetical protein L1987_08766 [Smallanthus sonchifolius]
MHLPVTETSGNDVGLNDFVEQEESPFMESPKRGSTEWTDEKHSLYLKSMEASFVDQLYNSLDTRNWQTENECSSDSRLLLPLGTSPVTEITETKLLSPLKTSCSVFATAN